MSWRKSDEISWVSLENLKGSEKIQEYFEHASLQLAAPEGQLFQTPSKRKPTANSVNINEFPCSSTKSVHSLRFSSSKNSTTRSSVKEKEERIRKKEIQKEKEKILKKILICSEYRVQ